MAGVEEQGVEEIVDSRLRWGHLEYLVQWKGFPREEREWKTSAELCHAKEAVADFYRLHPAAPRPFIKLCLRRLENLTTPTSILRHLFDWENGTFDRVERQYDKDGDDKEEEWFDALEQ